MNPAILYSGSGNAGPGASGGITFHADRSDHFSIHPFRDPEQERPCSSGVQDRLSRYEIAWFRTGGGIVQMDSGNYPVKDRSFFCFVPGQIRRYQESTGAEGYRLSFSHDFLCMGAVHAGAVAWLDAYGNGRSIPVMEADEEMWQEVEGLLSRMQQEFSNYLALRFEILAGLLNILLILFSRKLEAPPVYSSCSRDADLVRQFRGLVKEHFVARKLVADYADLLCVTPNYLNRAVKKVTGETASHLIQQQIILEAKRRAVHSTITMKEIAYLLGFDDQAHFSKFFKNNSGMSFTHFKRAAREVIL